MRSAVRWIGPAITLAMLATTLLPALAQSGPLQSYVAEDGSFWFSYPHSWQIETRDGLVYVYNNRVTVSVVGPGVLEALGLGGYTDPADLVQALALRLGVRSSDLVRNTENGRPAARLNFTDPVGYPAFLLALLLRDNRLGLIDVRFTGGYRPLNEQHALRIARSLEVPPGPPARLAHYAGTWRQTVAELEAAGAIPAGGHLLFQSSAPYTVEQATDASYLPLGNPRPAQDVIVAGELRFVPVEGDGYQACFLGARLTYNTGEAIVRAYLEAGLNSASQVYYIDSTGDPATSQSAAQPRFLGDSPHHLLLLALDDRLTVYLDGQRVFADVPVEARAGITGLGAITATPETRCEGQNLWVYEVTGATSSSCTVTAASAKVNRRQTPATNGAVAGWLTRSETRPVTGQMTDALDYVWWQLDDGTWVRSDVVIEQGDCTAVPVIIP
ncbi:MAG: hypothetical protein HPY64_16490 [Anaerolineae bacterium]|nr:hypothetical protein [Anaerolineae bacterium]